MNISMRYKAGCEGGDMQAFLPWLREHAKGNILEIGVRDGASTSAFLLGIEEKGGHLYSFDIQECGHLFKHPQWTFTCKDSKLIDMQEGFYDVALIDGDHSPQGYWLDLNLCYNSVKLGGLIVSHDIDPVVGMTFEDSGGDCPSRLIRVEYFDFCSAKNLQHYELPGTYGMGVMVR